MWLAIYAAGVLAGLLLTDARPAARVGLALAWPLGPLAFVVTIGVLLVGAAVAVTSRAPRSAAGGTAAR